MTVQYGAVEAGLRQMRTRKDVEKLRGVSLDDVAGSWKMKQTKKAVAKIEAEAGANG